MRLIKRRTIVVILMTAVLAVVLTGCFTSKKGYQDALTQILSDTREELSKIAKQRESADAKKPQSQTDVNKKELDVLKQARDRIEALNPPDDFYVGHADLVQFLDLYIEGKEEAKKAPQTTKPGQPFNPNQAESFKKIMAATRALGRAARELPFMEFDLIETFGSLVGTGTGIGPSPVAPGSVPGPGVAPSQQSPGAPSR